MQRLDKKFKYPRTFHLPWSLSATDDDKTLKDTSHFKGLSIVITEKMDGENTTIYSDGSLHARSLDSTSHPSQDWVRGLASRIAHDIPEGWRICGENMYARHSITYDDLETYFYVFAIYNADNVCLSWNETEEYAKMLGLKTVPIIGNSQAWDDIDERTAIALGDKINFGDETCEGYVIRNSKSFHYNDFSKNVAKFVRANHVQPDAVHWKSSSIVPNKLRKL